MNAKQCLGGLDTSRQPDSSAPPTSAPRPQVSPCPVAGAASPRQHTPSSLDSVLRHLRLRPPPPPSLPTHTHTTPPPPPQTSADPKHTSLPNVLRTMYPYLCPYLFMVLHRHRQTPNTPPSRRVAPLPDHPPSTQIPRPHNPSPRPTAITTTHAAVGRCDAGQHPNPSPPPKQQQLL